MRVAITACLLLAALPALAEVPTPDRPITDARSIASPVNPDARPVPIDDLGFTRGALSAAWDADGARLYISTNLSGRYNIWRGETAGSWPVQLTQSDDRQSGLVVSTDGRTLFYEQDHGGDEQYDLFAVPTAGGPVTNLTNTPELRESGMRVSPDGMTLAFSVKARTKGQSDVGVMDLATRKVRMLTTEADARWQWGPDAWIDGGKALIVDRSDVGGRAGEVWRIDVATGKATRLIAKADTIYEPTDATADGSRIAISTNAGTGQMHAGVYTVADGRWTWLKPTPWEQRAGSFSPDGRSLIVSTGEDGRFTLSRVDLATMAETPLPLPPGVNGLLSDKPFTRDGRRLLVSHASADTPRDIFTLDLADGIARPLTRLAMASLDPANLPKSRVVTFRGFDGTLVSAIVTIPFNLARDGRNPAIVLPHGGPTGQSVDGFSRDATALASRGYLVIQPNPRGSTGYGHAFQVANFQDLGGGDLNDELAAKDFLVATGYVDSKRVGITGGSYGGFMTLMAIGRAPDAFAAAVQQYGIIDWRTMWAHEDAELQAYQRSLLGDPDANPKVYDASSPLTYIRQAKAPLLQLQGENDIRVPRGQAQQVADILKAQGKTVETIYYPAEGHGFAKRENQLDALRRMVAWFDRYLKPASVAP